MAKVLTPASRDTKQQVEVQFPNGFKNWTGFVIPSHKAAKDELKTAMWVLFGVNFGNPYTETNYRFGVWYFGRVPSKDDLFKDIVEVNGVKVPLSWIRLPDNLDADLQPKKPVSMTAASAAAPTGASGPPAQQAKKPPARRLPQPCTASPMAPSSRCYSSTTTIIPSAPWRCAIPAPRRCRT